MQTITTSPIQLCVTLRGNGKRARQSANIQDTSSNRVANKRAKTCNLLSRGEIADLRLRRLAKMANDPDDDDDEPESDDEPVSDYDSGYESGDDWDCEMCLTPNHHDNTYCMGCQGNVCSQAACDVRISSLDNNCRECQNILDDLDDEAYNE
jgi:hypothetical protein